MSNLTPKSKILSYLNIIVLSFAPSAAAVRHCDRVKIACESNAVRHSVFFKRWQFVFEKRNTRKAFNKTVMKASVLVRFCITRNKKY